MSKDIHFSGEPVFAQLIKVQETEILQQYSQQYIPLSVTLVSRFTSSSGISWHMTFINTHFY